MARGGKRGRKPKVVCRDSGLKSQDRAREVQAVDDLLGISELEISEDEQEQKEGSSHREVDLSTWINMSEKIMQDVDTGKEVIIPILKQTLNGTVNREIEGSNSKGKSVLKQDIN